MNDCPPGVTELSDDAPMSLSDLAGWLEGGCKPREQWRVGTEHEKFGFRKGTYEPVPYDGPDSIRAMLEGLRRFGWSEVHEGGKLIALQREDASISLEPGGQFELSGAPLDDLHLACAETGRHLREVREVADELGLGFLGMGFAPLRTRAQIPIMPKARYDVMRAYMPTRGDLGLDMMLRTCTVQANLDFASEADMVRKMRVSMALQPIATALFANSPFTEGKPNGYLSWRGHIWTDTDPDRTGMLQFVFEDGFGFERYADWALDVPMYVVRCQDRYVDAAGASFRDFLEGRLPQAPGAKARLQDWEYHLTTLFPEVRLKRYLEMRGADAGPWAQICALPALWVGVLYDEASLDAAWELCKGWTAEDRDRLRDDAARLGLKAQVAGRSVHDVARDLVELARQGLARRARLSGGSLLDETVHLRPLQEIVDSGVTQAERLLERYHGPWGGDVRPVFEEFAY